MSEKYLGGLMSGYLKVGWKAGGYGIYATDRRIFGVRPPRSFVGLLVIVALVSIFGGVAVGFLVSLILTGGLAAAILFIRFSLVVGLVLGGAVLAWGQRRLGFQSSKSIEDLQGRKDFEITRAEISRIELKEPGAFRQGHLIIESLEGTQVKIMIRVPKVYIQVKKLMDDFCVETPPVRLEYAAK